MSFMHKPTWMRSPKSVMEKIITATGLTCQNILRYDNKKNFPLIRSI